jgi:hypothetical protein
VCFENNLSTESGGYVGTQNADGSCTWTPQNFPGLSTVILECGGTTNTSNSSWGVETGDVYLDLSGTVMDCSAT